MSSSGSDRRQPWEDHIIAERMEVDREFADRVAAAGLSNQSWELVMTAIDLEIVDPERPSEATLVAKTQNLGSVLPTIASIESQGRAGAQSNGGILDTIMSLFSGGGSGDAKRREVTEQLASEYTDQLQRRLKDAGKWETVCKMSAGGD